MRLEKNFPTWFRELRPIYGPFEAGLYQYMDVHHKELVEQLSGKGGLSDELKAALKAAFDTYKEEFVATQGAAV